MKNEELLIKNTKQAINLFYPGLKWLTEKEAKTANKKRYELMKSLSKKISYSFMQNKIHIGNLSPGCLICGQGYWSCIFINGLCTENCFYCVQDRKIKKERPPVAEGIIFDGVNDYIAYLEKFNYKGVGFSGGETLLVFGKLLTFIKKIKRRFGKKIYVWVYTNGDLINKNKLRSLKEAGLDEIRFNISANGYNLHCVELATKIINTVTVEIPCIPEDYKIVKKYLLRMQKIGVKHLNIHQLFANQYNYKNLIDRGYTFVLQLLESEMVALDLIKYAVQNKIIDRNYIFVHQLLIPILESEMVALDLIKYAVQNKISLSINYCSSIYKSRFQGKALRERRAPLVKEGFEESTSVEYIRSLSIQDTPTNIKKIIKILKKRGCPDNLWQLKDTKSEIFIQGSLLKHIDFGKYNLTINYFEPELKTELSSNESGKEITLNSKKKLFIKKEIVAQYKGLSKVAIKCYQKLFIENLKEREVKNYFFRNYNLKTKESLNEMKKELEVLKTLKTIEHLESGISPIY